MYEWQKQIQIIVDEIDSCIKSYQDEALTLRTLSQKLGYSELYNEKVQGDIRYEASGISPTAKAGLRPEGNP